MADDDTSSKSTSAVETKAKPAKAVPKKKPQQLPPYNVVLLDDDDHTAEYVIEMLRALFGYSDARGFTMAEEVDSQGRVIVLTTHKERAEFKCEQILAYGGDHRVATCKGSMSAVIEPAEG